MSMVFPWSDTTKSKELRGHKSKVHCVKWGKNGECLASGSTDFTARIWSLDKPAGKNSIELKGHTDSVDQLMFDPNGGNRLATASADKSIRIWDTNDGSSILRIATPGENINLCWHPNGNVIAVGNKEDLICFIDVTTGKIEKRTNFAFEVNEMTFSPCGNYFFITTGVGCIQMLSYPALNVLQTLQGHTANCYCLEFDPTKKFFAVGSADALASLWDANSLVCLRTFPSADSPVRTLSFSHDGNYLALASESTFIDIADIHSSDIVYKLPCFGATNSVSWHPKDYILAFAGDETDRNGKAVGNVRIFGYTE